MTFTPDQAANEFSVLLERAGAQVVEPWFLPAASGWTSIDLYRERVYCYELYHQLRVLTSPSINRFAAAGYLVSGEMDKAGLDNVVVGGVQKPDLIWHIPGGDSNATVVEVKSVAAEGGHSKDIETLSAFVTAQPAYARGIYLFFGEIDVFALKRKVAEALVRANLPRRPDLDRRHESWPERVEVWLHREAGPSPSASSASHHQPTRVCDLSEFVQP